MPFLSSRRLHVLLYALAAAALLVIYSAYEHPTYERRLAREGLELARSDGLWIESSRESGMPILMPVCASSEKRLGYLRQVFDGLGRMDRANEVSLRNSLTRTTV
jgi:hypothetical protein